MVRLQHSADLYHNMCIHDGEDLPLCSKLAAKVGDTWCFDIDEMDRHHNCNYYEAKICPSEVAWDLIKYNMKVDLQQFCHAFQCGMPITKRCFEHLGLKNPAFEEQCDQLFGEGRFEERTEAIRNKHQRGRKCSEIMQPQNSIFGAF